MVEFTTLPLFAGGVIPRAAYNELLNAINNRRAVVLPDETAAFTIYNNSGDADSATVEIDTAADEIYLIVVGGASADDTAFDLAAAAYDTITELVAAINALGKGWVAVEMSGAQTAHADNASETLLSSGPTDVLTEDHITWFTNYAPNGVRSGSLIGNIVAYRAAIDALAGLFFSPVALTVNTNKDTATTNAGTKTLTDVGAFIDLDLTSKVCTITRSDAVGYGTNSIIVSNTDDVLTFAVALGTAANVEYFIRTKFSASTLHYEAFGSNDWDAAGAPNLTPLCLPHEALWNNMKYALDIMTWTSLGALGGDGKQPGSGLVEVDAFEYHDDPGATDAVWNTARADSFSGLTQQEWPSANSRFFGRFGSAKEGYTVERIGGCIRVIGDFATSYDYANLINTPTLITGFMFFEWNAAQNEDYYSSFDFDVDLGGNTFMGGAYTLTPVDSNAGRAERNWHLIDAVALAGIVLDGTDNDVILDWASGNVTDDPGVGEWPAPISGGINEDWIQYMESIAWGIIVKFSWD